MSEKEIENNTSNEEASETVETPESVDSTPETAETVADAEEASAPEESAPEEPAETAEPEADVPAEEAINTEEESAEVTSIARLEELSPAQIVQNFEKSQLKEILNANNKFSNCILFGFFFETTLKSFFLKARSSLDCINIESDTELI